MRKNIIYSLLITGAVLAFTACSDDDLSSESVIVADQVEMTEFDYWLEVNFVQPYNIDFKYRYEYNESDYSYYTVPANYEQSVEMAHIVKYSCIEAYDEVAGIDFTRANFPKMFFLIGEWEYNNNGTFILGTAEGGKKILLSGINYLDTYKNNIEYLNYYYLKTIHHEFTHILNQNVDYSSSFQLITSSTYVADSWSDSPYDEDYLLRGYISAYAQQSHTEDFAEMLSMYVTNTADQWEEWMEEAESDGGSGRDYLESKLDIVRSYMSDTWGVDIDELRSSILRREQNIADGKIDLTDLTIN